MRRGLRVVVVAAQLLAFPVLAAAEEAQGEAREEAKIYECKTANGDVVYQDEPCLDPPSVRAKPPQHPKPTQAPKSPRGQKATRGQKAAQAPKPPTVSRYQTAPKPAWVVIPGRPTGPPAANPPAPVYRGRTVDVRWQTPRKTLKTFLDAVTAGDRSLIWDCLTSMASTELAGEPAALPLEKLRDTVSSFTGYVEEGDLGPFWSIRASRAGMRPKWIFFERTATGEWKIAGI